MSTFEYDKFSRQLRLMVALAQNRSLKIDDLSRLVDMNRRSIYRYLDYFRRAGFEVVKENGIYRLDYSSQFFKDVTRDITFTEDEALVISQVLSSVYNNSVQMRHIRQKLSALYDPKVLVRHGIDNAVAQNISAIHQAIEENHVVTLVNYYSASSQTTSNRVVEPFMFLANNNEVRCYEYASGMNKTFKLSRVERVEDTGVEWTHKTDHAPFYGDLFGFAGERRMPVSLILGRFAASILLEEFPDAERQLTPLPDGRHRFDTEVCSYLGIGRFVLGLFEDIEIAAPAEFADYIRSRAHQLADKMGNATPNNNQPSCNT